LLRYTLHTLRYHGLASTMHTDSGSTFTSDVWSQLMTLSVLNGNLQQPFTLRHNKVALR
jgi:hypothetical protein